MVEELMAEFGITHVRDTPAIALSGGERRRVEIARALATHPSYILLDEPLAGIDPIAVGEIRDLVGHLKDRGIGVLITDHNVRDALDIIDRAYIIHEGQVLKEGIAERNRGRSRRSPGLSRRTLLAVAGGARAMALTQRLEIRQGQSLVMTPQLQQAIKLLQLSNMELTQYVEQELERNPLLERDESEPVASEERETRSPSVRRSGKRSTSRWRAKTFPKAKTWMPSASISTPKIPRRRGGIQHASVRLDDVALGAPAATATRMRSSARSLKRPRSRTTCTEQLTIAALDPDKRLIGAALIDAIDEAGYLRADLARNCGASGRTARRSRGRAACRAGFRSYGRRRARSCRVPGVAIARARPLRSGDASSPRKSPTGCTARNRRALASSAAWMPKTSPT